MMSELNEPKNPKPQNESSNISTITLGILILTICVVLYVGYEYFSDSPDSKTEIGNTTLADTVAATKEEQPLVSPSEEEKKKAITSTEEKIEDKTITTQKKEEKQTGTSFKKYIHTVEQGESFVGIANRHNISVKTLKEDNPDIIPESIKVGVTKLKIRVKAIHTVGKGDILRVVAEKYGVSKKIIMTANKKQKDIATRGEKLIIPLP